MNWSKQFNNNVAIYIKELFFFLILVAVAVEATSETTDIVEIIF